MSRNAFIFPGQGSQAVGMGKDLAERFSRARELYDIADEIMQLPLSKISFDGPADDLKQTNITQPALFVHSYILTELIKTKISAEATAGHSLGEYTADAYSGVFSFETGLNLVKTRGMLMKRSGEIQSGTMAALIGLSEIQILEICDKAKESGIVQPANYNCPGQIIISGDVSAVENAIEIAKAEPYKCRIAKQLEVSGAFHSELMKTSDADLRKALAETQLNDASIPVYTNFDGNPVADKNKIMEALSLQLVSPVRWEATMLNMISNGIDTFYEIGSGKVLTGLLKKIKPDAVAISISTADDIDNILKN